MTTHIVPRVSAVRGLRPAARGLGWSGLDRLFEDFWHGFAAIPPAGAGRVSHYKPRVDIEETDTAIHVSAELPGLEEKDFEVTLEGDVLTIHGERKDERDEKREGYLHLESNRGSFRRALRLPFEADAEALRASYKNGVLEISVPKPEEARPRVKTIPVTAG